MPFVANRMHLRYIYLCKFEIGWSSSKLICRPRESVDRKGQQTTDETYFLQPGYILCAVKPQRISTVLGSSVAICLYDPQKTIGGICHFLYPYTNDPQKATALYGNAATPALVKMMFAQGASGESLEAQIFGGARNPALSTADIGYQNIRMARRALARYGVRVVSEDVGGRVGRKIVFDTGTNEIAVLHVDSLRETDWYPYSKRRLLPADNSF